VCVQSHVRDVQALLVLMGGTLTSSAVPAAGREYSPSGCGKPGLWGVGSSNTLLGPEGTGVMPWTSEPTGSSAAGPPLRGCGGGGGFGADRTGISTRTGGLRVGRRWVGCRDRPYLENCTVDASIFVAKLLRAHGGCLGTRSR
jgi:hypothetical protein